MRTTHSKYANAIPELAYGWLGLSRPARVIRYDGVLKAATIINWCRCRFFHYGMVIKKIRLAGDSNIRRVKMAVTTRISRRLAFRRVACFRTRCNGTAMAWRAGQR